MNQDASLTIARNCILGKYTMPDGFWRAVRDHGLQIDTEKVKGSGRISETIPQAHRGKARTWPSY